MSISSELLTLNNTKTAIRTAINNKGGSVEASTPFADYATAITNLPSGGSGNPLLTSIDVSDFSGTTFNRAASYITDVTIPSGVTTIQSNAFENCGLTTITIPNSVTTIGSYAFYQSKLTSITIPSTVRTLGQNVFQYCTNLTSITLPNNITVISAGLLSGCSSLTNCTIPETVTTIQNSAFENCGLTTITIPNSVTTIGYGVFQGCRGLTSVIVNATTPPTLDANAFNSTNDCPIYVPAASVDTYKAATNWSTYASRIFAIEDAITFTPTNGDPAISVKNYELATAGYVQSTDVPSTIKNGAGSLEICEGVTRIGQFAFQSGTSLTSVTLPSTITRIDEAVFYGCSSLTSVTVNATTPPTMYGAVFGLTNDCPIYVPAESVDTYKAANNWSTYASRIQAIPSPTPSVTSITFAQYQEATDPGDWGDIEGCGETVNVDAFEATSSGTFDSDIKAAGIVLVEDNNGNDITSQCTFTSSDYTKTEDSGTYYWSLDTYIGDADAQNPHSATITATYGNLSDTFTIEWTTTSNCSEPEPDPEEPEE